jgi:hypothetical protein
MGEFRPNFRSTFHFLRSTLWKVPPGGGNGTFRDKVGHFQSQSRKNCSDFATQKVE